MKPKYRIASTDWNQQSPNPFRTDGTYGLRWSSLTILESSDFPLRYIGRYRNNEGLYCCQIGSNCPNLTLILADYITYESMHGRTVIIAAPAGTDVELMIKTAMTEYPRTSVVRPDDGEWAVHSTTLSRWERIQACGQIRSIQRLHEDGIVYPEIGFTELREPEDFREYVVLADFESINPEFVVASHGKGCVITEENSSYEPGVRLYFDAHKIIRDGLAVRDGLHSLKIHDHLRLIPYFAAAISVSDMNHSECTSAWTPRSFLREANNHFRNIVDKAI